MVFKESSLLLGESCRGRDDGSIAGDNGRNSVASSIKRGETDGVGKGEIVVEQVAEGC